MRCDGCKIEKPELQGTMFTASKQFCDACSRGEYSLKQMAWHRNGVAGLGFYVAIVHDPENGDMLVIRFNKEADYGAGAILCAAFKLSLLDKREIKFGVNSWRGDHYSTFMDQAIEANERPRFAEEDDQAQFDAYHDAEVRKAEQAEEDEAAL
jgi:hypothetical protein